jgi:hypothetical protein
MRFAFVAFDEHVFGFDDALLGGHRFDLFTFFAKPGHGKSVQEKAVATICRYATEPST